MNLIGKIEGKINSNITINISGDIKNLNLIRLDEKPILCNFCREALENDIILVIDGIQINDFKNNIEFVVSDFIITHRRCYFDYLANKV